MLEWNTHQGVSYAIQESADLETWVEIEDGIPGDGSAKTWPFARDNKGLGYFRILETR